MLSLLTHHAARMRRALPTCFHSAGMPVFLAKAREASRGRHRTPSNGLKDRENLPFAPILASPPFFALPIGAASQDLSSPDLRISRMIPESFGKNPASA
jgi:hypothetical protein